MATVYLVIPSASIGGAEKRLVQMWLQLRRQHSGTIHTRLIINRQLLNLLSSIDEFADLNRFAQDLIAETFAPKGLYGDSAQLAATAKRYARPGDIVHFAMRFPIFHRLPFKTIYSFTESNLKNVNWKGRLNYYLSFFRAAYNDILDPDITEKLKKIFFYKAHRFFNTPGSFIDGNLYQPAPMEEKKNWIIFLGRFEYIKQIVPLCRALPFVHETLLRNGISGHRFILIGNGTQEAEVKEILGSEACKNIPVQQGFNPNPKEVLQYGKIILSLQLTTNFPSKSLLEGMACGCLPLVTDAGSTRRMAAPEFSYYVPEHFTAAQLAEAIAEMLKLNPNDFAQKSAAARGFVVKHFTIETMTQHFVDLYERGYKEKK
jgi:glycosyltransferase involved in cell wall biosynthesis